MWSACCADSTREDEIDAETESYCPNDGTSTLPPRVPAHYLGRLKDDVAERVDHAGIFYTWKNGTTEGCYSWISNWNDPGACKERVTAHQITRTASCAGGYLRASHYQALHTVELMKRRTCAISDPGPNWESSVTGGRSICIEHVDNAIDVAEECMRKHGETGGRVALINTASAYKPGGGFTTGRPHTQEEAICTQSTLFEAMLMQSQCSVPLHKTVTSEELRRVARNVGKLRCYIPEEAAILSPDVEFFRDSAALGYPFKEQPFRIAGVLTIAMPVSICNFDMPMNTYDSLEAQDVMLEGKFRAVLKGAIDINANVLVVPIAEFGLFGADARRAGLVFARTLRKTCLEAFDEIHVTGAPSITHGVVVTFKDLHER
eukprot:NODE_9109_length_1446_cov_6.958302.p1 GENE.NODE_9109_length_1446_cov_6.958302~~NODE_9109_length_1446_cov_6.958302.p1  ORF type:complete len:376 (-),score=53.71 NODE_9109_length_1446_cov_6.958302:179-1306(-)